MLVNNDNWDGENPPTVYKDFLGQEVRVGDYICYGTVSGSSAGVAMGKVLEFKTTDSSGSVYGRNIVDWYAELITNEHGQKVRPSHFQHTWRMKVQPLLDSTNRWRTNQTGVGPRAVILSTIHNVHKVDVSAAEFEEYE